MATKYTLSGLAFGLCFPLAAWSLDIYLSGLTLSPDVIVQIHQNNAIHYIVDLAPLVLGSVFYFLGKAYQRVLNRNYFSSLLAEDRVTGSTSRFNIIISLVMVFILLFFGTASWYIQHEMKLKAQAEIGNALDIILTTTEQAAYFRLQEEQSHVLTWARTKDIVQATQALLLEQYSRRKLIASPVKTTTLRTWFEPIREIRGYQGFFIISPEGVNLASSRDSNIGEVNMLTQHHPDFLQKIWQGDTALSTPHHAYVALLSPEGKLSKGLITIFVGAPIKDESGQIIAALTFRLDPHVDLSPILRQGRIGESGETYAFIREGEIITQSRFDQQIKKYGLTFIDVDGTEHLEIRDPGVNLTLGEQTDVPRSKQPFTRMAISAMAGESGQDLEGYRDYRGVPVIGSWLWSDRLGFGMTTEIDVVEGYAVLNFNRRLITISSFILGILILGFFTFLTKYLNESRRSKQILIENEQTSRLLLNSTGEAIYGIDLNGECIFANKRCLELLGNQSEQELLGKNMHVLIHHTHNDGTPYPIEECKIFQAFKTEKESHVDDEVLWRADGSSFDTEYRSFPLYRRGEIIGSVVSFTDISDRKILEQDRNQAEETLMAVVKGTASVTGADFFNSMARHLASAFGVQYAFVTECIKEGGSRVRSLAFWHIDHFADTIEYNVEGTPCKRVTMEGCPVYYASGVQKLFPEDRDLVDLGVNSYLGLPIFNSSEAVVGHVVLLNPTAIDDASRTESVLQIFAARAGAELERLQAEREREEISTALTQLIETVNAPIYGVDIKGTLIEWNKKAVEVTGYSKQQVLGKEVIPMVFPREHRKRARLMIAKALKGHVSINEEIPICHKDGSTRQILFNINTSYDVKGNIIGAVGVGQDITELRLKETALQQAQKMEAVGQLTGGIAHDFNNLLSIIIGNLRFLQQDIGETSVEINELFEDAISAVNDGTELTQRLLGFSRNRALLSEIKNVNEVIEKFVRFLTRTLAAGVELNIDLPDESLFISVDSSQLENALLNLTLNARDAMPKGGTITISATRYNHSDGDEYSFVLSEDDYIKVSVTDTGTGISSEDLPHVYEPFFTTKEVGKGSGLGLSMVYGFTQQSGGACHISSTPGKGTTVSMFFPEVMGDKTRDVDTKEEKEEHLQGTEVILVVEDEPRVRRVALRDLKNLGYKTLEAENAAVARAIIESGENIDLLFSDILMPGEMDGHMLGIWTEENYPSIKVVLTSGYSKGKTDMSRDKARQFPLVRKPYTVEKLAKQLRTTLTG